SFGEQFPHPAGRLGWVGEQLARSLGRDVAYGQHARRRARLPEALVVRVCVLDQVGCGPDLDLPVRALDGIDVDAGAFWWERDRADGRQLELVLLFCVVAQAPDAQAVAVTLQRADA